MASDLDLLMLGSLLEMFSYLWCRTTFLSCIHTVSGTADSDVGHHSVAGDKGKNAVRHFISL